MTSDEIGFEVDGEKYPWAEITQIHLRTVDMFTIDSIEFEIHLGSRTVRIWEELEGYHDFLPFLYEKIPAVNEPVGYLTSHAFSDKVFIIDIRSLVD